jgi:hypothetical protein
VKQSYLPRQLRPRWRFHPEPRHQRSPRFEALHLALSLLVGGALPTVLGARRNGG